MPLARYQIRNEYGLADPELYKAAERDDPEALLEGVAMAGLVGVLRQLGDLAEFAAEIFHDLHEEVMATAARGHGLVARVQQLETDFPSIEKAFLSQTSHSPFFSAPGIDWHPNLRSEQNLVTRGDLPRFVMDSYEECRGPPRLFLLDKYDVAGAGACLKRYTDPSFFKVEAKSNEVPTGDVQREKKVRKMKKKAARVRNGETSGTGPASHAKLHQLLMKERIENGHNDSARAVKLKKRHLNGYPFDAETGKSYMVQFVETQSPEHKVVHEVPASPPRLKFRSYNRTCETEKDASEMSPPRNERSCSPPYDPEPEVLYRPSVNDVKEVFDRSSEVVPVLSSDGETDEIPSSPPEVMDKTMYAVGGKGGKESSADGYLSDDIVSEVDNYMDALTTMESEMETDNEHRVKNDLGFLNLEKHGMDSDAYEEQLKFQNVLADSQSIANSSSSANENGSLKKGISSISYSDTSSNLAENTPFDGDEADKVLPSNKPCIADAPSNKLSTSEILESKSDELDVPNNMYVEEVKISDPRGTSPSNKLSTGEIVEPKSDRLQMPKDTFIVEVRTPDTRATSCVSAELVETLISDRTQFSTISSNADGTEINLADSSDVFSSIPSQNGDHILFAVPDETNNVNKFDDGGLGVTSDAPLHLSNISEGAREKRGSEYSGSEVQAIDADRYSTENFDGGEIGSAYSVSPADEQQLCSVLPEVETSSVIKLVPAIIPASIDSYSDSLKFDDIVTEVDHDIPSTDANLKKLVPMVDASESRKSTEEQVSGIPDDVPELDRDLDERSDTVDGQETGLHRCSADDEEREDDPLEVPCSLYNYTDHEDRANLGDMITETVQAVDAALSFASAGSPDDGINDVISSSADIVSSPRNLVSFHEFLSDFGGQHQGGLEYSEEISPGCLVEPEVKQEATQLEFALTDSDSDPKKSASYTEDVSVTEQDHNSSHVGDVTTTSLISQLRTQVPEPISPQPDDLLENSVDASPSSTSLQETGVPSQQFSRFQIDEVHIENLKVEKEQLQSPIDQEREIPFDVSKPSPEDQATTSELSPQSADLEVDFAGQAIDTSYSIPGLTEVVPGNHASPASGSEDLTYQSSPPEFLPQSSIHEADRTKQAIGITDSSLPNFGMHTVATQDSHSTVDGLDSSLPLFGSFPESTPDHLEMPPLPPLPPMQWRMGKVHNAPFPSLGGSFQSGQDSCNTALSSADDDKAKSGFLSEGEILQPQNPFVPHTPVEDERSQHNYMVNDLAGGGRQPQDSFLTFPTILDDRETHAFHTPGGEIAQSSYIPLPLQVGDSISRHDPVSSQGNLTQPLNQSATETAAGAETIQHIFKDLEGQGDTSPNTSAPLQSLEDEQPQNGLTRGEIAWYSKASAFVPFEVPKPNGNSTMKIPRPRSPLIDAVAAHDKSTLRKVTERARPQIEPKADERDSLLEQIRMKSFNLKPAVVTRPSIQGPKTNLKVAAILEKANAIRQALAGSDDEDDADSWSDS